MAWYKKTETVFVICNNLAKHVTRLVVGRNVVLFLFFNLYVLYSLFKTVNLFTSKPVDWEDSRDS